MIRKGVIFYVLITFCLRALMFAVVPIRSGNPYDPWADINEDGKINMYDIGYTAQRYGATGDSTKNVNVTNWPSPLLPNFVYDSGMFTLGPWNSSEFWTNHDLNVAGYRQVSICVSYSGYLGIQMKIRVRMGDFTGQSVDNYNWITYGNETDTNTTGRWSFVNTVDVRGPQLRIAVYNFDYYSLDGMRIAVYVTC